MRSLLLSIFIVCTVLVSTAQKNQTNNDIQTILPKGSGFGAYGALSVGYTQINGKDALVSGARAGIILDRSLGIGVAGYGFMNDINYHRILDVYPSRQSLAGGYGGIFIEPIIGSTKAIHLSFPVLFGGGGLALLEYGGWGNLEYLTERDYDPFLLIEPAAELEFNFTRFLRVAAYASYRFTTKIDLGNLDERVMRGTTAGITVKIGRF